MLQQITGEMVTTPKFKLSSMRKRKDMDDIKAQGKMLDKTVVSPAQMKADEEEELKKKKMVRSAMFKASAEKINPYQKKN